MLLKNKVRAGNCFFEKCVELMRSAICCWRLCDLLLEVVPISLTEVPIITIIRYVLLFFEKGNRVQMHLKEGIHYFHAGYILFPASILIFKALWDTFCFNDHVDLFI